MELEFKPAEGFVLNSLKQLDDTDTTRSEEIWLFQYPISQVTSKALSQFPDIEGGVIKFDDLDKDGIIGGFEDSSGTKFDLVSYAPQETDSTVIMPSEESKIAGKISRRVSLVCYPEPKDVLQKMKVRTQQKLVGAVTNSSGKYSNPTQSSRHKSGQSVKHSASSRSSRQKSMFSGFTETPKSSKRKHSESSSGKHDSSTGTVSGSTELSEKSKKKKKMKMEE